MEQFLTIPEIIAAAQRNLSKHVWDFSAGGAESEATLRRNRAALDRYLLRPRVLRDVSRRTAATTFLGHPLDLPVMLAPVGSISRFHPDGAAAVARVAGSMGTIAWVGTMSQPRLEDVAQVATGPLIFQLYVKGDRDWVTSVIRRVERAGYNGLCITVDSAVYGRRERDLENRFFPRDRLGLANFADCPPDDAYQETVDWEYLRWIRSLTRLPIILKGIMTVEDALLAVQHGVDVIYVSNHGGRQLDHCLAPVEVLEDIVQAVRGRAEIIVDSGFLRGTDVIKAIALGARAVLIGKLQCWGLAAAGEAGLKRVLELLRVEIETAMALVGVNHLSELNRDYVFRDTEFSGGTVAGHISA